MVIGIFCFHYVECAFKQKFPLKFARRGGPGGTCKNNRYLKVVLKFFLAHSSGIRVSKKHIPIRVWAKKIYILHGKIDSANH